MLKRKKEKRTNQVMFVGNMTIRMIIFTIFWMAFYQLIFQKGSGQLSQVIMISTVVICSVVYEFFVRLYNGFKSGTYPVAEIVIAHILALFFADFIGWAICSAYGRILYAWYIFGGILVFQVLAVLVWAWVMDHLYLRVNIPRKIVVINGEFGDYTIIEKLTLKKDKFEVVAVFDVHTDKNLVSESILHSEGILLNRLEEPYKGEILRYCLKNDIRVYIVPEVNDLSVRNSRILHQLDTPLFMFDMSLQLDKRLLIKRTTDFLLSLIALIILSPLFLLVAIAIRLEDGGPIFFLQKRYTLDNREFKIIKFRSMKVEVEKIGVIPTINNDPRITRVGRLIRATRIDELPQLINIIKGDMSIVGPRPERIEHVKAYTDQIPEFTLRSKMRGGLTGYAQIYGKYNTTAYDKLCLDLMYIENWSLSLDVKLILLTIKVCLKKESTEGFSEQMAKDMNYAATRFMVVKNEREE